MADKKEELEKKRQRLAELRKQNSKKTDEVHFFHIYYLTLLYIHFFKKDSLLDFFLFFFWFQFIIIFIGFYICYAMWKCIGMKGNATI